MRHSKQAGPLETDISRDIQTGWTIIILESTGFAAETVWLIDSMSRSGADATRYAVPLECLQSNSLLYTLVEPT